MAINLTVPVTLMRETLGQGGMKERKKGYIVNVASKSGLSGAAAGIAYTASKHALVSAKGLWRGEERPSLAEPGWEVEHIMHECMMLKLGIGWGDKECGVEV
jgi:hypothetical protein